MPPNTNSGTILDQVEYRYKQLANPYSETKDACFEECPGTSGSGTTREDDAPEQSVDVTIRVTTRARLTYELYNYTKNAMLIVTYWDKSFDRNTELMEFKNTFEKFRFEVEVVNIGLNSEEIYEKCGQFFQRDFTDYGAVALVIMAPMQVNDMHNPRWRNLEESVIMDNFKLERNPTLADKPKIYITEVGRGCYGSSYDVHFDALERATHGDVIGFQYDIVDENFTRLNFNKLTSPEAEVHGPLVIFCKKLAAMGDNVALPEIIAQTIKDSVLNFPRVDDSYEYLQTPVPIVVVNTLNKELYFARVEEN